ncbi:hypothetical protein C2G38_2245980 [Gigaspora rosea]|uniref:F-box domain-containing protein n=1 Tax=Gigaspora rosea TaxID=44941 RepID=A0A397V8X2_9GLOM|nr:hypothetical protein C2G38_2245980 [Gigaspora rosea]
MIALPNESLFAIFNYLKNEDLFSCLLVNRKWCRIVVPILWSKLDTFKSRKLIRICLLSLNAEETKQLLPFKIMLPNGPKPLFEYSSFIKTIYFDTDSGIIDWLDREGNYPHYLKEEKRSINVVHTIASSLIAMFLRKSVNLRDLRVCEINYNQMINLAENLSKNTALKFLGFANNKFGHEGGKELAEILGNNSTLTYLYIGNNQLGTEGGIALAEALCKNTTLTHLNLWNNQLGPEGGKALANALRKNTTLTYLNIGNNQLGLEGGIAMAEALHRNTTLTHLLLYNNKLCPTAGEKLAKALHKNTTLTYLNVGSNQLSYVGGKAFADALRINIALTSLDFRDNFNYMFQDDLGHAFIESLCENSTLTDLCLYNNNLRDTLLTVIDDMLTNNRKCINEYCKKTTYKSQLSNISSNYYSPIIPSKI